MQLRTVCDKRLYVPTTSGSFEAKISIDNALNNASDLSDKRAISNP